MNSTSFQSLMWKWTIIPFAGCVLVAACVALYDLARFFFGAADALQNDAFEFCVFVLACAVPLYLFLWVTKKIVTGTTGKRPAP